MKYESMCQMLGLHILLINNRNILQIVSKISAVLSNIFIEVTSFQNYNTIPHLLKQTIRLIWSRDCCLIACGISTI